MCVPTGKGNMFIAMCKPTIFINITRNSHNLFILFTHFILPHVLHTDNTQCQTLTTVYEPAIHDSGSRQITFCVTHTVYILKSIQQPINALNYIQFMTNIKMLHVSAGLCYPQEVFQIKGIQGQDTDVGIASPSQKLLKYCLFTYFVTYYVQ
jgi:hypothetical protein